MKATFFIRLLMSLLTLLLLFHACDVSAQKKKRFVKHPSISFGYGQAFLTDGHAGHLFSLAVDIPQNEARYIAFEVTHAQQDFENRVYNSQGSVIGGYKYSYKLSDIRVKYGFKLLRGKFFELKTSPFASGFFERYSSVPFSTTGYPVSGKHLGIGVGGELKGMFIIEDAVSFFAGTNYTFFRVFHARTRQDNPTLLERQRNTKRIDVALLGDDSAYWIVGLNLRMW